MPQASSQTLLDASPPDGLVKQEFRQGWRTLLACTLGIGFGLSPLPPFTAGLFATALENDFGWSRGQTLGSIAFITIALVLLGPIVGKIVDKHGARKMALGSTLGLGASLVALSQITEEIWTFYACWAVMSVVALGTLPITFARVITSWFTHGRGLALGIALASTGVTGALAQFFVAWAIDSHGWRAAYLLLATFPLLGALPIQYFFLKDRAPAPSGDQVINAETGNTLSEAARSPKFWSLSIAALALGSATGGLIPNMVPMLEEGGLSTSLALQAMSALAISIVVGRLVTGFLLDRFWAPAVSALLIAPALFGLAAISLIPMNAALALSAAITIGLIAGAEFDLVAYMTSRYFGRKHFSQIYGVQFAIFGLGSGLCPALYGSIRDYSGTFAYLAPLSLSLCFIALVALLTLGRYPTAEQALPTE
jgi:MFS family permease